VDGEFTLDNLYWSSCHSSYTRCVFRQTGKATSKTPTSRWRASARGNLGRCPSTYQDRTFDHVDFGLRDGGFLLGEARFERCTFRYCSYRWFRSTHADFIDCTFIGVMQSAWFWGATPQGDERPRRNQFTGNDLSRAKPRRVEFRNGLDLSTNRLPEGPEYLHLDRFRECLERARVAVADWPEEERRHGVGPPGGPRATRTAAGYRQDSSRSSPIRLPAVSAAGALTSLLGEGSRTAHPRRRPNAWGRSSRSAASDSTWECHRLAHRARR
jgi:hypothetical protein